MLDADGTAAAADAMSKVSASQRGFSFTWTGYPDIATTDDCSPGSNNDWYCAGRPILRTVQVNVNHY